MNNRPVVSTTATMNVSRLTLDVLEQFVNATRDWPRDAVVKIAQTSHRNESNTCITATLDGAS